MSASTLLRAALVALALILPGCGGAEEEEQCDFLFDLLFTCSADDDDSGPPEVLISQPASTGVFSTTAEGVRIAGTTSDSDADIQWFNSAGGSGQTSPDWEPCFFFCEYEWGTYVPLAIGENLITVVASNGDSATQTSIMITRQATTAQWTWVR